MKIASKTIRLLSSILIFPVPLILGWLFINQPENFSEENLISEYSQKEKDKENSEKSSEETQQKSNNETAKTTEKSTQESNNKSTEKNATQEKQSVSKNETTSNSGPKNNASSTSSASVTQSSTKPTTTTQQNDTQQSTDQSNYEAEVVKLCNNARQEAGVAALQNQNSKLQQAANIRATEIEQNFSHTRPNGTAAYTVLDELGISYTTWGENIAYGQKTPQEVFDAWMGSPGHKANILNANFKEIAVGMKDYYWVQEFM
jgi:uncharacterized protein YkwD